MKWIPRLLALFVVLPAIELVLLLQFHRWTGFWATAALILGTGLIGGFVARREGLHAWRRVQDRMGRAQIPGAELIDAVIILVAGVLLVTPGLLSDVAGLLGLFPPTRAGVRKLVLRSLAQRQQQGAIRFYSASPSGAPPADAPDGQAWHGTPRQTPGHARDASEG